MDSRLPEHTQIKAPIRETLMKNQIYVNTVTVMEVAHYLTRNLNTTSAREKIEALLNLRALKILDFDRETMNASLTLLEKFGGSMGLGGRDATIIASLLKNNIEILFTHDYVLKRVASRHRVTIVDPVP
jgi:predicted nucleic acid-binding protein